MSNTTVNRILRIVFGGGLIVVLLDNPTRNIKTYFATTFEKMLKRPTITT